MYNSKPKKVPQTFINVGRKYYSAKYTIYTAMVWPLSCFAKPCRENVVSHKSTLWKTLLPHPFRCYGVFSESKNTIGKMCCCTIGNNVWPMLRYTKYWTKPMQKKYFLCLENIVTLWSICCGLTPRHAQLLIILFSAIFELILFF